MRPGDGLAWLESLGPQKIRPGLARTRALLAGLGHPESSFTSILVGGTNGKGSTAAAASAILTAAGVRAGLTTSPHLVDVTERVRVGDVDVTPRALDEVLSFVAAVSPRGELAPTYFEALVVCAFEIFRRRGVAIAVVEVGIGGRLDATNVLDPAVSIVTNVAADHLETLGPALADVAREKGGIFRAGRPALTAASGETLEILRGTAERIGAHLVPVAPIGLFDDVSPLPGLHQRSNLALALAGVRELVPVDDETARRGVAALRWPGRLQRLPRPGRADLILDGAHNPAGAAALADHLDAAGLSGRCDLVFGGLADKDLRAAYEPLGARARRTVLTAPDSPRAESPARLAARLGREGLPLAPRLSDALKLLDSGSEGDPVPIIVTGSLVLVGEALRLHRTAFGGEGGGKGGTSV